MERGKINKILFTLKIKYLTKRIYSENRFIHCLLFLQPFFPRKIVVCLHGFKCNVIIKKKKEMD